MSFITSRLWSTSNVFSLSLVKKLVAPPMVVPIRNYAARKGTRERKMKKKVKKVEEAKVGFIPHNQRKKDELLSSRPLLKFDDSGKSDPIDNVYHIKYYKSKIYPFEEAVQCHRETHHPDMYNVPDAFLNVKIELNMQGEKSTRFVDNFQRIVAIAHKFDHGEERSIIAFSKSTETQKAALDAGVQLAGGVDLIKQIQNGDVSLQNFDIVIAHPEILPELVALRGLMRRKFPNPKLGTLDIDLATVAAKFLNGIKYSVKKDEYEKDFGLTNAIIGTLNMDVKGLEENFAALIRDIEIMKPKRSGHFISRCLLWSPPSRETFKVDHNLYLQNADNKTAKTKKEIEDDEDEDEVVGERVAL